MIALFAEGTDAAGREPSNPVTEASYRKEASYKYARLGSNASSACGKHLKLVPQIILWKERPLKCTCHVELTVIFQITDNL